MSILTEYRKGIMFLRVKGNLNKKTYKELESEINNMVDGCGINNIVINLEEISKIDMKGISSLYYIYEVIKKIKGNLYLYLGNNEIKSTLKNVRIFNYMNEIDSELKAFDLIKI